MSGAARTGGVAGDRSLHRVANSLLAKTLVKLPAGTVDATLRARITRLPSTAPCPLRQDISSIDR
jgi:hypothetical protein